MALPTLQGIELFSGVGMLSEGLRAGFDYMGFAYRTLCHVEREAYPGSVMVARMEEGSMDAAPVWSDVTTFDARKWRGKVDCVVAGFPCQDLSVAGRRAGLDGARSGLFFQVTRIAEDCGAWCIVLENVAGIATATATVMDEEEGELEERAVARVLGELADLGWDAEWITLSASDVGASHGRARWFCIAWKPGDSGLQYIELQQRQARPEHSGAGDELADANCDEQTTERRDSREVRCVQEAQRQSEHGPSVSGGSCTALFAPGPSDYRWPDIIASAPWYRPALSTEEEHDAQTTFAQAQSVLRGMADGLAAWLDFDHRAPRLRCGGNGVVALQAACAFVVLFRRAGILKVETSQRRAA